MRRLVCLAPVALAGCFNFGNDFNAYCARTGACDGGLGGSGGGGFALGGGAAAGGGSSLGGGSAQGGGAAGGAQGGGGGGIATGGGSTQCTMAAQCSRPPNGTAFCDAGVCNFNCNPGAHLCAATCALDTSVTQCGAMCSTCSAPPSASPACDAGACDFTCQTGFARAGNTCFAPPILTFPDVSDLTDPNTYIDARLDPSTPTTLWTVDFSGQVSMSTNLAMTALTPVCKLPGWGLDSQWTGFVGRPMTRLFISPASDHSAYVISSITNPSLGRIYRADVSAMSCLDVTPFSMNAEYLYASAYGASFSIAPDGALYEFDGDSSGGRIRRSADRGATWAITADAGFAATYPSGFVSAGPGGDLLISLAQGAALQGLYLVTDAGTVSTRVSAAIYGNDVMPRFSIARPGEAYASHGTPAGAGYVSMNGGQSWSQNAAYTASGDWAVDPTTNAGYRMNVYDGGLNIEQAIDMISPVWLRVPGGYFPGQGGNLSAPDRIDAVNGNLAAVIGHRLFISTDQGSSFRRVGSLPPIVERATLDSADGTRVFMVSGQGMSAVAYESTDKGLHYAARYVSPSLGTTLNNSSTILVTRVNPQNPDNVIAWAHNPGGSTYTGTMLVTHDGFNSGAVGNDTMAGAWFSAFSFAPSTPILSFFYSQGFARSVNSGDTYTAGALTPTLPFVWYPQAQVMGDPTYTLVFDNMGQQAFRVNNVTLTTANDGGISDALGNDVPTAAEVYSVPALGTWRARVISRSGWLALSDDNGATFSPVTGSGTLPSCAQRHVSSLPSDRTVLFSWCDSRVWVSRNGGLSWLEPTAGQNWVKYGCGEVTSLVATDTRLLVTCEGRPPVMMAY